MLETHTQISNCFVQKMSRAWPEFFRRSHDIFRRLSGLDRSLCILIMIRLADTAINGDGVTIEEIVEAAGSYTSFSTARRYLLVFVDRGYATIDLDRVRKGKFKATPALIALCAKHLQLVGNLVHTLGGNATPFKMESNPR